MEKGSTLMEKNIGELGGEGIFILHEDHRPTSLIDTWEFCKDYKESGNFQTGVLVSPGNLELVDLNISPLEVVENAQQSTDDTLTLWSSTHYGFLHSSSDHRK